MKILTCLVLLAAAAPVWAQSPAPTADTWIAHRLVLPATRVDISHLGVHTHADEILFQTARVDVGALQANPSARNVRLVAHCRYPTDAAALPPGFGWLTKNYGAVPTYGPIDGSPGWSLNVLPAAPGRSSVKVSVPTRFANWVGGQTPAAQRRYKSRLGYSLEISWEQRGAG